MQINQILKREPLQFFCIMKVVTYRIIGKNFRIIPYWHLKLYFFLHGGIRKPKKVVTSF